MSGNGSTTLVVGSGFLGGAVLERLAGAGAPTRLLTRRPAARGGPAGETIVGDPANPEVCRAAFAGCSAVVWCAGDLVPASPVAELSTFDDLTPLVTMAREAARRPGTRFVLISSGGTVYGNPVRLPVREDDELRPTTTYGATKARAERWASTIGERQGMATTILRCSNVYGPGQRPRPTQGVIAHALACALERRPLTVIGDPSVERDYVYIDDVVSVIEAAIDGRVSPVLNVGSGVGTKLHDLVELVRTVAGPLETVAMPARPTDLGSIVLDITRLREELPDLTRTPLSEGIERAWTALLGVPS